MTYLCHMASQCYRKVTQHTAHFRTLLPIWHQAHQELIQSWGIGEGRWMMGSLWNSFHLFISSPSERSWRLRCQIPLRWVHGVELSVHWRQRWDDIIYLSWTSGCLVLNYFFTSQKIRERGRKGGMNGGMEIIGIKHFPYTSLDTMLYLCIENAK